MKKALKRILTFALVLVMLSMVAPAFADDKIQPVTGTQTIYLESKEGTTNYWFTIAFAEKDFTIKRSSVKVTPGDTGAKLYAFEKHHNTWAREQDYQWSEDGDWETSTYGDESYGYQIYLRFSQAGTAKVTYKIGKKSYTLKIVVKAYTNPISSITMTGVNKGKSFASKCKTYMPYNPELSFPSAVKSSTLKVKAKTGWKVTYISFDDVTAGKNKSLSDSGLTTMSLKLGKLDPTHEYCVSIDFLNTKTGATLYWYFTFGNTGA